MNHDGTDGVAGCTSDASGGRRQFLRLTAGASVVGLTGLAGCTGGDDDGSSGDDGGDGGNGGNGGDGSAGDDGGSGPVSLTYAGSEDTSANFQAALPYAERLSQHADPSIDLSVQSTGGLDANVRGVSGGNFDVGATNTPNFQAAAVGEDPFQEVHEGFRLLFSNMVYPFPVGFTTTGTEIDYIEDMEGGSVSTGPPGSAAHTYFRLYCLVNEIDFESMDVRRLPGDDAYRQLGEGQIDAVLTGSVNTVLGPTSREFIERNDDAKLVAPTDPERTERLQRGGEILDLGYDTGGVMYDFPLATFQHAHENSAVADQDAYTTVAGTNTLFTTPEMSDDVAYEMVRVALEYSEELADATPMWQGFHEDPDYYATAIPVEDTEAAPFHPGAVEALEEAGVWDDDLVAADE